MMKRRDFLQTAALGSAGSLLNWKVLAQSGGDAVTIVAEMNANSLDVHSPGANRATYGLGWMVYDRLISFGVKTLPNGILSYDYFKLEPQLAESWTFAPDNGAVTFKLRRDATFHDGTPVTAKDVKWSFDRMIKVGGFPQRQMEQGSLSEVDQFEALDDYTFMVKFLRPDKLTMPSLAIVVPAVYNSELCKKNATTSDPWALDFTKNTSAGSGAYKVDAFKSNDQVVLSRFPAWKSGTPPKIARAMYRNVGAAGTRRALVEHGDADMSPDLPPRDVADIVASNKLQVDSAPMANTLKYLSMSTIIKPFDDVRVRRAVAYAIPYKTIIDNTVFGRAKPMFGAASGTPATDTSWPQPFPVCNTDPDKAKALLEASRAGRRFRNQALFFDAAATSHGRRAGGFGDPGCAGQAWRQGRASRSCPTFFARRSAEKLADGDRRVRRLVRRSGLSSFAGSGMGRTPSSTIASYHRALRWTGCWTPPARSATGRNMPN